MQGLHVMLVALQTGFLVLDDPTSGALLIYTLLQSAALLGAAGVMTREAWRLTEWPGSSVKLFLGSTCVCNLVSTMVSTHQRSSSSASSSSSSSGSLWCGLALTLLSALLFLFGLYKETLRSPEEKERLELDRVSVDVHDGNLLNGRHNSSSTRESRLGFWNSGGFFQLLPPDDSHEQPRSGAIGGLLGSVQAAVQKGINFLVGDPIVAVGGVERRDVRDGRGLHAPLVDEDGGSDWGQGSAPLSRTFTNTSVQSSLTSASAGYDGAFGGRSRSHDSAFSFSSSSHQPVVRSALESHLGTSVPLGSRLLGNTAGGSSSSGNSLSTLGGGGAGEDRERINSGASSEMGVALQRALDAQRARMSGYSLDGAAASPSKKGRSRDGNGNASIGSLNRPSAALATEEEKIYSVTVARWGLRRDRIQDDAPAPEGESSDRGGNDVEIEFELDVRRSLPNAASEWSQSDQHSSAGKRDHWTVWRTAAEVLQLHSSLASAFGDVVPRRPRLRSALPLPAAHSSTAAGEAAACSPSDIAADMRAVGIYLMALLRGQVYMEYPGVLSFLEVWDYDSSSSNVAQLAGRAGTGSMGMSLGIAGLGAGVASSGRGNGNGNAGSATVAMPNTQEKWRKLFVSLRVRVKPHEVGVKCRLFEGVVSGAEITAWLTSSGYSHLDACCIGQRLVECGLLVTVCSGYHTEDGGGAVNWACHPSSSSRGGGGGVLGMMTSGSPEGAYDDDDEAGGGGRGSPEHTSPQSHGSQSTSSLNSSQWNDLLQAVATGDRPSMSAAPSSQGRFSDLHGNLYTFQQKHATSFAVGKFVLFGTTITATISQWVRVSDEEGGAGGDARSQTSGGISMVIVHSPSPDGPDRDEGAASPLSPTGSGGGSAAGDKKSHVEYIIACRHGGDEWTMQRRYQQFAELHRALTARGIKPAVGLPPKTFTSLKSLGVGVAQQQQQNDVRRTMLENYLTSVLEAVVASGAAEAQGILARFLDEDFDSLIIL